MHLQQTKAGSRASGGPQYYFHNVAEPIKEFLRRKGACRVVLQTPYGIASSPFLAVGKDHRLDKTGQVVRGCVGHDRIQQAADADESVGEAIRRWYGLPQGRDFERIEVEVSLHAEGHFILVPLRVALRGKRREHELERPLYPLSFNDRHQSAVWRRQIESIAQQAPGVVSWAAEQIERVVSGHAAPDASDIHEADLLRVSGALSKLGVCLGPYRVKGYDCRDSRFQFLRLPPYPCPVEVKKLSRGFRYQMLRYFPLPRAVVLCLTHDLMNPPEHIDVVELSFLARFLSRVGAA